MGIPKMLALVSCGIGCAVVTAVAFGNSIVANPLGIYDLKMFALGVFFGLQTFLNFHSVFADE